jgi:uncharacterized protein YjbI with pentapeptide repeats
MSQDQQPQPWWKDNWLVLVLAPLIVLIATVVGLGYWQRWAWTGVALKWFWSGLAPKSAWDWLELLIIPIVLGASVLWFNRQARRAQNDIETRRQKLAQMLAQQERGNDRHIAEDRARDDALRSYFDRMSELILDKNLGESDKGTVEQVVASARTLAVIRSLEGDQRGRKIHVIKFLIESNLIGKISLSGADLSSANLIATKLSDADLSGADLSNANLSNANLIDANLTSADLSGADLKGANLRSADLSGADLRSADLSGADLRSANLSGADLSGANLFGVLLLSANLTSAHLSHANLTGIHLSNANLSQADLRYADLSQANLRYADLSYADLSYTTLRYVNLRGAGLAYVNLSGASLSDAKEWTNEQLAQAESLVGATLPDGTLMTSAAWEEFKKRYRKSSQAG